jgi:capsular exopolysaccharide synthesis family protein
LGQPFLSALPLLKGKAKNDPARVVLDFPDEVYTEAVYTAATSVLLSAIDTPQKIIAVTSSVPGEGKSTFSINLALSQAGEQRVLLIDADLRRPSISSAMDLQPGAKGLMDLIAGKCKLPDVLQVVDNGLHVIPAGKVPAKPLELLRSKRFQRQLASLRESYDLIVIDCPPVQLVSDALIIGRLSTSLIYVVKASDTRTRLARAGLKRIESADISVLGVVLNQQDLEKAERYYGDSQGTGKYGYGSTYSYSAKTGV